MKHTTLAAQRSDTRNYGLRCPVCSAQGYVLDSRVNKDMALASSNKALQGLAGYLPFTPYRRRRYKCSECEERWTTVEVSAEQLEELFDGVVAALDGT